MALGDPRGAALEEVVVVRHDVVRLGAIVDVLAEVREEDAEPFAVEPVGRLDRVVDFLARHEAANRPLRERKLGQVLLHPRVAGHPQEAGAHRSHGDSVSRPACDVGGRRFAGRCAFRCRP